MHCNLLSNGLGWFNLDRAVFVESPKLEILESDWLILCGCVIMADPKWTPGAHSDLN